MGCLLWRLLVILLEMDDCILRDFFKKNWLAMIWVASTIQDD